MRTTLNIDDDLLAAAKELACRERSTASRVISRLLRRSFTSAGGFLAEGKASCHDVAGFRPFRAKRGKNVTNDQVSSLLDGEGI